MAFDAQ